MFSIGYSWSFSKLFEGYIKISNFISVISYGFYREKLDDVDVYYRLTGKKNIMLMFGGIVGNVGSVQYMFEDFLDQYDIIYPVYPITNKPIDYNFNENNDIIDYVEKINMFLRSKKINMVHIIGWSFGGFTSNVFLKKYPHYIIQSKFIAEGLITPFSCVTSHMLINEPLTKSFNRLSLHMQNKYFSAMVAYAFLFKLKNIKWVSYMLLNFRNVQWTNESLNTDNTTLYFSKNDFLLPIDFHQHYIDSFSNATVVIDDGSHGYYFFSEKFKETLREHFTKYKFKEITRTNSCTF
jgi:pimeloyl-ACP methyl ester carboxylesterase